RDGPHNRAPGVLDADQPQNGTFGAFAAEVVDEALEGIGRIIRQLAERPATLGAGRHNSDRVEGVSVTHVSDFSRSRGMSLHHWATHCWCRCGRPTDSLSPRRASGAYERIKA